MVVWGAAFVEEARAPMEEVICSLVPTVPAAKARNEPSPLEVLENDGDDGDDQQDPDDREALGEGIDRFVLRIVELARVVNRTRFDHCVAHEDADLGKD